MTSRFALVVSLWLLTIHLSSGQSKGSGGRTPADSEKGDKYIASFFDKDTLHSIKIFFTQCNYWDSLKYYKHLGDSLRMNNYMQANVLVDGKMLYACGA